MRISLQRDGIHDKWSVVLLIFVEFISYWYGAIEGTVELGPIKPPHPRKKIATKQIKTVARHDAFTFTLASVYNEWITCALALVFNVQLATQVRLAFLTDRRLP